METKQNNFCELCNVLARPFTYDDLNSRRQPVFYKTRLIDLIMIVARRYEMHNNKVIRYFASKYGNNVDDYLLIIDLRQPNPWKKILKFLNCHFASNKHSIDNIDDFNEILEFPTSNQAPDNQPSNMIPVNMTFDWKNYEFFDSNLQHVFNASEKYYRFPYSMQHKYYQTYNDSDYINLFEKVYENMKRDVKLSESR